MRLLTSLILVVLVAFWGLILYGTLSLYHVHKEQLEPARAALKRPICMVDGRRQFCKRGE